MFTLRTALAALTLALFASFAHAQATGPATQPLVFGGVQISPDGVLSSRTTTPRIKPAKLAPSKTAFVSLPRALAQLKSHIDNHTQPPADLLNLGNLTQIQYVFAYPDQHDLILAGPTGPLDPKATIDRPTLQLDDLIVALRATRKNGSVYGCSLDLAPGALASVSDAVRKLGNAPNATVVAEIKKIVGPQLVRVIGVPDTSRLALAMLAADYHLKRLAMGVDSTPGLGSGLGASAAANRLWFTAAYEPLLVSEDGNSYELRGPRLRVDAGAQLFEPRGASEPALKFARNFSDKMPVVATRESDIADLQNVTDLLIVAALIHHDRLAEKAALDLSWALDTYTPAAYPAPKTADTIVNNLPTALVAGGVGIFPAAVLGPKSRAADSKNTLAALRQRPAKDAWLLTRDPPAPAK